MKILNSLVVLLAVGAVACAKMDKPEIASAETAPQPTKAVEYGGRASPGKPGSPVIVRFRAAQPVLGVALPIKVDIEPQSALDNLQARFQLSNGLSATQTLAPLSVVSPATGVPLSQTITVTPQSSGQHFLTVFVTTVSGGQTMQRVVSHSMIIDQAQLKTNGALQTGTDGRPVISMPSAK